MKGRHSALAKRNKFELVLKLVPKLSFQIMNEIELILLIN